MDDFLNLLIIAVIYLFAAFSRAGKKKGKRSRKQRGPMRSRVQGEQRDARSAALDKQTQAGFGEAYEERQNAAEPTEHDCGDMRQMHLHEVSQMQFADALEGEDPCHAGGMELPNEDFVSYEITDDQDCDGLARDVLRGVVMSEILMRPHERAMLRQGRR